ncbi:rhomboid family intramembrane serine protease [Oceaniovalibus sp. ACAM 378]|uniref:rhomboid family intramembrane serine protease n=1 Tax=Oceaniovalibus sp. ACAM 378 TaxID=2599923 RepID=UPI0011D65B44|nr:rhomboid family intramembrane serine protease [Oceaniovalibus sp. ACAM 378]TYB90059.1 rhomboid family intramembrane serine protease [Oceaniovalibus sp. ACAM 378]
MFPIRDHNPSLRTPFVTWALIVANVAVFLLTLAIGDDQRALSELYFNWALIPQKSDPVTYITSQFMHGGFLHLAGNMLFLWIFGDNLEEEMGHGPFLIFYLAGGIAAGLAQTLSAPGSTIPMVGASGAIAAVMGGYLLMFPKARVDVMIIFIVFFRIFAMPAWIVLGVWFGLQMFSSLNSTTDMGGVAYWAHAGGFAAGVMMALPLWRRRGGTGYWSRTAGRPPHPDAQYRYSASSVPRVGRRR